MSLTCGYYTCIYIYIHYIQYTFNFDFGMTNNLQKMVMLFTFYLMIPNDMKLPTRTSICDSVMISQNGICWMSSFQQTKDGNEVFSKRTTGSSNESHRMRFFKKSFEGRGWHAVAKNMCCRPEPKQVPASRPANFKRKKTWKCSARFTPPGNA